MTVRERLNKLKNDSYMVIHKLFPKGVELLPSDWIRIYKSKNYSCIDEAIYTLNVKDIDSIPESILDIEFDEEITWFLGGDLSLDLTIII